jgi:hypothetical protein
MNKREAKNLGWVILLGVMVVAFSIACLGWANQKFIDECEKNGGTVGSTSNGYKTCTGGNQK